jgi:hypothetical protein
MSAVAVQKAQAVPSPAQPEAMDTGSGFEGQEDLYTKLKTLQRQLEFLDIQVSAGCLFVGHSRRSAAACLAQQGSTASRRCLRALGRLGGRRAAGPTRRLPARRPLWATRRQHVTPPTSCAPCCAPHLLQEDYIKEEQKNLKNELLRAQEEVKRIQASRRQAPAGAAGSSRQQAVS